MSRPEKISKEICTGLNSVAKMQSGKVVEPFKNAKLEESFCEIPSSTELSSPGQVDESNAAPLANENQGAANLAHAHIADSENDSYSRLLQTETTTTTTFEEYFRQPEVQRVYRIRLLLFELRMKICFVLASILCSIMASQKFYREKHSTSRTTLFVMTLVLWISMTALPFAFKGIEKFCRDPIIIVKIVADGILRIFQAVCMTLWVDLIFVEIWISHISNDDTFNKVPIVYAVPVYYILSLTIHLVFLFSLAISKTNLSRCQTWILSQILIVLFLIISLDVITRLKFEPFSWSLAQICLAALFAEIEHFVNWCTFEKLVPKEKSIVDLRHSENSDRISSIGGSQNI